MFHISLSAASRRGARQTFTFGLCVAPLFTGLALAQKPHDMATMAPPKPEMVGGTQNAGPLQFESVLSRYKPMTDQKLGSWRDANDTVTRIGGWRTYLKESQQPDAAPTVAPANAPSDSTMPKATAPANPHAGHGAKP